jgi:hypothetical protein
MSHSNNKLLKIHFNIIFSLMPVFPQRQSFSLKLFITCTSLPMLLLSYSPLLHSVLYDERKLRGVPCCAVSTYFLLDLEPNNTNPFKAEINVRCTYLTRNAIYFH